MHLAVLSVRQRTRFFVPSSTSPVRPEAFPSRFDPCVRDERNAERDYDVSSKRKERKKGTRSQHPSRSRGLEDPLAVYRFLNATILCFCTKVVASNFALNK